MPSPIALALSAYVLLIPMAGMAESGPIPSTDAFLDTIGIATHMGDGAQIPYAYSSAKIAAQELQYIGVRHVRDSLLIDDAMDRLVALHEHVQATFDLVFDYYGKDGGRFVLKRALDNVRSHATLLEAIEGPNEPDWFGITFDGKSGAAGVQAAQQALYDDVKKDDALRSVPVYCPALSYPAPGGMASAIGSLAAYCDVGTSHPYMLNKSLGLHPPDETVRLWTGHSQLLAPGRPVIITETGWETCPQTDTGIEEDTQAKYMVAYLLDAFALGIKRTFLYELAEEQDDLNCQHPENHYGLFRHGGAPKMGATALHNLHEILSGSRDGGGGSLAYSVTGLPSASGHQLLLRKDQRTFVLALWNETLLWDPKAHHALASEAGPRVRITLDQTSPAALVYDPLAGSGPQAKYSNVRQIDVTLPDHPLFVELTLPPNTAP